MSLIERVEKSEVFADLTKNDRKAILDALKAGDDEVIQETQAILEEEDSINKLFEQSVDELTEDVVSRMTKRLESLRKRHAREEQEIIDVAKGSGMAEIELAEAELALDKSKSK